MSIFTCFGKGEEAQDLGFFLSKDFGGAAQEICQRALKDAQEGLHPLLRTERVERLKRRPQFVQAFRLALERQIARKLVAWQTEVQAIYRFDESIQSQNVWDGSIHLLARVPRLSRAIETLGKKLDRSLLRKLQELGWSRFRKRQSILEVQQVTQNEMRHGVSYGAMFLAVHTKPEKVWPLSGGTG